MKQRFSSLDVKVIAHELAATLVNLRLNNIYDLNSRILLFKFQRPNTRQQLLIESGFRCHVTSYARTSFAAPTAFVSRLRKVLKTRRVTGVSQIGTDRTIELKFSDGTYRLYLEFFASGNVILTDANLNILALLRNVSEGEGQEPQRVGLTYCLENKQNLRGVPLLTKDRVRGALEAIKIRMEAAEQTSAEGKKMTKKMKKQQSDNLKRGLATILSEMPPVLLNHAFRISNYDTGLKPVAILQDEKLLDRLFETLAQAQSVFVGVTGLCPAKGYIIAKNITGLETTNAQGKGSEGGSFLYEEFHPFLPSQFEANPNYRVLSFDGFNKTVDEFFSSVEGQKLESRLNEREEAARRKLEATKQLQQDRINGLRVIQTLNQRKAAAIESNIERVQEAMDATNGLLEQGMDWVDITNLIEREKSRGNPVAEIFKLPLKLAESTITLLLGEEEDTQEEEKNEDDFEYSTDEEASNVEATEEKQKQADNRLDIDIKLNISPWANATEYYGQKRTAADKEQKTIEQSTVALRNAEQKIEHDLKRGLKQEKPVLQPIRKQAWFEKFLWFVSSDGYLVLGGRDAQQNETLYRRCLKKGDVYVHADLDGAPSVVIKNNPKTPNAPIPPSTLEQAGSLCVCGSNAWESKTAMSPWWVRAEQVSKTTPAGDYLPAGSFLVKGEKRHLPAAQLTLGFGLLFKISEDSWRKHVKLRVFEFDAPSDIGTSFLTSKTRMDGPLESKGEGREVGDEAENEADEDDGEPKWTNLLQSTGYRHGDNEKKELHESRYEADLPAFGKADSGAQEDIHEPEHELDTVAAVPASVSLFSPFTPQPADHKKVPLKRGQRAKAKKLAKYKDLDDEDRELMEQLIGITAGREKAEAEAAARAKKEAEIVAQRERRRQALERQKQQIAKHEEARKSMMQGDEGAEADAEIESLLEVGEVAVMENTLYDLVGSPTVGDEILEAVPYCAPWGAMTKVKYKFKLQPGALKRGKAMREILEWWKAASAKKGVVDERAGDKEKMWPREVELIRGVKVEEAVNCVPVGKVTIMASGGHSLKVGGGGVAKGGKTGKGKR